MRLPVLMYHDISPHKRADALTIPVAKLAQQLHYIKEQGYTTISLRQFHQYLTIGEALPSKPLLLTFDDGYTSNFTYLYPLLQQYQMKAGIFLVADFVNRIASATPGKYLQAAELRQMNSRWIDYGYHSFSHSSYAGLSAPEIEADLQQMNAGFQNLGIEIVPLFAYPYGASPRKDPAGMQLLQDAFKRHHIHGAFRIGNRINTFPVADAYHVQRIDVRGTDPFWKFRLALRFGRKWIA